MFRIVIKGQEMTWNRKIKNRNGRLTNQEHKKTSALASQTY